MGRCAHAFMNVGYMYVYKNNICTNVLIVCVYVRGLRVAWSPVCLDQGNMCAIFAEAYVLVVSALW